MTKYMHCCEDMAQSVEDDACPLVFVGKFREYGIQVLDGGTSYKLIDYCPWCGVHLPEPLRNAWFDEMEARGVDPMDAQSIPEKFRDESWYESA